MAQKQTQAAPPAPPPALVRVRVRGGARVKIGLNEVAVGGQWIEVDPTDLKIASFRASVETDDDLKQIAEAAQQKPEPGVSVASEQFAALRRAARAQADATASNRQSVAQREAEQVLKNSA